MNFPRFWARGQSGDFYAWRWSMQSLAEAQTLANQAVQQLARRILAGDVPSKHGTYYPSRPFREQILQEIKDSAGQPAAVVTRNSYGCQVLNTAKVMFVDIDFPEPKAPGLFHRLFGKPNVTPPTNHQGAAMNRIENWTRQHSEWGWRIYKTRAGLRAMATQGLIEPDSPESDAIFEAFGADPLYRKLCVTQKCFRARLTPKPWRCGVHDKPERWPWLDEKKERRFQKWETNYQSKLLNWATCDLISQVGNREIHPDIQPIIDLHDTAARVGTKLQLA